MIRLSDVYPLLQQIGLPVTYRQFSGPAEAIPDPPYIVYYEDRSSNMGADNVVHTQKLYVTVELYTDCARDMPLERRIKDKLTEAGLFYETSHSDLPEEGVHITYFEFSIFE